MLSSSHAHDRLEAVGLMFCAVTLFSCLDASAKYLVMHSGLPTEEVVWMRFVGQFVPMLLVLGAIDFPGLVATQKPWHQLARSCLMAATTMFNFIAVRYLRLDQTVTIAFLAPLLVALLAGPFLGEWVGWRRFFAILVGFCGILIAVHPGFQTIDPAYAYAFGSMIAYSAFMLLTRYLAAHDAPKATLFFSMFVGTFLGAPFALAHWVWPHSAFEWGQLLSLGAFGGLGHFLFIHAYRLAPASIVTPFLYLQLLSMAALGYLVFGDVPDRFTIAGATVVIASGLYLLHRERVVKHEE